MFVIPSIILGIAFLFAAATHALRGRWEQMFTRLLLAGFYIFLFLQPTTDIETARSLARYFTLLLALVEVLTFVILKLEFRRRRHDRS